MKMMATIELEFESEGETTNNAMDAALIRGLEALKKGIELREDGTPRRSIKPDSTKWNIVQRNIS
jgi:ribonuclease HI